MDELEEKQKGGEKGTEGTHRKANKDRNKENEKSICSRSEMLIQRGREIRGEQ
jgi:hypothetical protein